MHLLHSELPQNKQFLCRHLHVQVLQHSNTVWIVLGLKLVPSQSTHTGLLLSNYVVEICYLHPADNKFMPKLEYVTMVTVQYRHARVDVPVLHGSFQHSVLSMLQIWSGYSDCFNFRAGFFGKAGDKAMILPTMSCILGLPNWFLFWSEGGWLVGYFSLGFYLLIFSTPVVFSWGTAVQVLVLLQQWVD